MRIKTKAEDRRAFGRGPFQILRNYPGLNYGNTNDLGIAGLGCIDHSIVSPGFTVKMHEHNNDEILSYIRQGKVSHTDRLDHTDSIINSSTHLMLMNAGNSFWHEEKTLGNEDLINMQIFVRPRKADLAANIQFSELDSEKSENKWRKISGPEELAAPLHFRSGVSLYDTHLQQGSLTTPELNSLTGYLYIISGEVAINENELVLREGDGLIIKDEQVQLISEFADVLFFEIDESSDYSRAGTISG